MPPGLESPLPYGDDIQNARLLERAPALRQFGLVAIVVAPSTARTSATMRRNQCSGMRRSRRAPATVPMTTPAVAIAASGQAAAISRPVVTALLLLFSAVVSWLIFKLLGSEFSYRSALAVTVHASMPYVVSQLLSLPVILSRASLGFDDLKTGSFLQSNLAFLAPADAPTWQLAALASLDFFGLWGLVLSIIGYRAVSRLSTQAVAITMIVLWLVFVGIGVGLAAAFS